MAADKQQFVKDWFAAWNSQDAEKIAEFYTDDGIFDEVPTGKVSRGKSELIATFKNIFIDYPDLTCEQKVTFYSPSAVCGEFVMSGTRGHSTKSAAPENGKHISVRVAYIIELQKDKIKRHTDYFDGATIEHQLGLT